jgi:hypothetical protein
MTNQEIQLYFPHKLDDNLEDLYEERLFEFKQFFLTKPVILKVFNAKIERLRKFETAYRFALKSDDNKELHETLKPSYFQTNNILTCFNNYQEIKNEFKKSILQINNSDKLILLIDHFLKSTLNYINKWENVEIEDEILISKEPDPMELLTAIKVFNSKGGFEFHDIVLKQNICPKILMIESKRLSLQSNIENNG